MKFVYLSKRMWKVAFIILFLLQTAEAMMRFMPIDQLVATSEYIVVARVKTVIKTDTTMQWIEVSARVVKNELQVIESIKGSLSLEKPFIVNALKFDGWMEDNVELPSQGSKVLLFLERDKNGELKPIGGIQGVWYMKNGKFTGIGQGITLQQIREIVSNQQDPCTSQVFISLLDTAEKQTQAGQYKEALESYKKVYQICAMRDLEEQMAWLMGEVEDDNEKYKRMKKDRNDEFTIF